MSDPALPLLRRLVAIDSVNPSLVPGAAGEAEIARAVEEEMRAIGLEVEVSEVVPGRPNVIGVLEGRAAGRSLMLCGHLDTVGVEGMAAPFKPMERDGLLYGRGSQDMKGGVAAMLGAARLLAERGGLAAGRLIVAAVVDEEYASLGAEALARRWRADGAVVAEPTDLRIAVAHKGFAWVEVATEGRAAHGSRPGEGRDAIFYMGRVLARLEALDRELQSRPPHPLLGTASLHASWISGGTEMSTYPARCVLKIERRTLPRESGQVAVEEVNAVLDDLARQEPEFRGTAHLILARPALELPAEHELPQAMMRAARRRGIAAEAAGMTFWTDAAILAAAGIPAVLFGPRGAGLHSKEECVRIVDVIACRDIFAELAKDFCGGSPG